MLKNIKLVDVVIVVLLGISARFTVVPICFH